MEEADARAGSQSGESAKGIARIKKTTSFFVCFFFLRGGCFDTKPARQSLYPLAKSNDGREEGAGGRERERLWE